MNWIQLEEHWKVYAGSARAHWSKLTEQDWQTITGKKEQLAGLIQERYGIAEEAAGKQVDEWFQGLLELDEVSATRR